MKKSIHVRLFISLFLLVSMLSPVSVFAFTDGKKHFSAGMKHEDTEQWDKAVEEFALAVADSPKNPEFRLHLTRALFNASQMFMKKGTTAAKEKDYEAAYVAFRRSYAFDPTNELAKSEMERMVRLQRNVVDGVADDSKDEPGKVKMVQTGYVSSNGATPQQLPQKLETLRDILFPAGVNLQSIIKELANYLDLNVLFDKVSFNVPDRKTYIELHSVTPARALDYLFLQEDLFFQKVGPRTILVANQAQRMKFQQLVLRTFYLSNASPKDVAKVVQTAIPAQPGRSQTIVLTDDATNSITIRDTEENIRLIGKLITSLDKDRAEVVMDVAIYEVNKSDLMQFGNQLGTASGTGSTLTNIGGVGFPVLHGGPGDPITRRLPFSGTDALSIAIGLPVSSISALQTKSDTKLIASTQIHAFNNEDSSARIGQRVPVRSATFQTGGNVNNGGVVSDVINYEQVGLTLKFKPIVFPNQDVQVAMEIESKDVAGAGGLTPTFTERTIKGTARIQNNKTLLLASVAQGIETKGRSGLPLLGMIPIIGRLFSAPTRDNRQVDIVIAVTPRVIRAPAILPDDEIERPTGSLAVPTNSSLEAMLIEDDHQEMLAAARRAPNTAVVQLPDRPVEAPEYVRTDSTVVSQKTSPASTDTATAKPVEISMPNLRPIDSGVKTLKLNQTSDTSKAIVETSDTQPVSKEPNAEPSAAPAVELRLGAELPEMKVGDKLKIPVLIKGNGTFRSAVMGLKFDAKQLAVRNVTFGDVFGTTVSNSAATPFLNQNGKMYVSLTAQDGKEMNSTGTLAFIEIEVLKNGRPEIAFDRDVLNFLTADGKNFTVKFQD
ncbi:MAG: secretin N-terminal domain-containing protein [Pyrinomonadaceae bacterium]